MKSLVLPFILMALAISLLAANVQYSYDAAGRLIKVDYGDGRTITYTYDAAGNLLKRERTGAAQPAAAASATAVSFEANQGQIDSRYQFLARRGRYSVAVSAQEALFSLPGSTVRLEWLGANANARAAGLQPQAATTNYLTGADSSKWRTGVRHYGRIQYANLFPGIDVVYYGNPQQLEYDLIVHPGADPSQIRFRLDGASQVSVAPNGDLVMQAGGQTVLFQKPVLHQTKNGVKRPVTGAYHLADGSVGFRVGTYDRSLPLIIDPVFGDYTLAGGSGDEFPTAAVEDAFGFLYVVGTTNSTDLPGLVRPVQPANGGGATDVFVMKLSSNMKTLVWVTYLGGSGADTAGGISVDREGIVTISGATTSQNFPVSPDALQRTYGGGAGDGFVARLNAKGERLLYSTYLGGSADDAARSLAVDSTGIIYAAGVTASANFLTRPGAVQDKLNGATDGFLVKFNPGDPIAIYSTLLGGTAADTIQRVAIDAAGNAYVAGTTSSTNFPTTTGVLAPTPGGGSDGFVSKINPAGSALVYSTFLGGSADDQVLGLAVLSNGNAFVSGVTASRNLPMGGSVLNRQYLGGPSDGFLLQLSANASQLLSASYLGGNGEDSADAIAIRVEGTILVAVNGTSFPGEPARMYAFSGDLSRELGIQTISAACTAGGSRIVALAHSSTRSLAVGWARATGECQAPQWLALPDKTPPVRMATSERENTGHAELAVGTSGTNSAQPPPALPRVQPYKQTESGGRAGDPFSTATGEHTDEFTDLSLGGPFLLQFKRYYSSALVSNEIAGGLGLNWAHNFDLSLTNTSGTAVVTLEGGARVTFRLVSGAWQMQPQQKSEYRLLESANDYKLGDIAQSRILTFNKRGQLTRIEDRNGNALQVTLAAAGPAEVTDGLGRSLKFTYTNGFLTEVRDHSGRSIQFAYRGENLRAVTDVFGRATRYEYASSGRLTRHLLPAGTPAYTNVYDSTGRVAEQSDAEGRPTKVAYEAAGVTAVTDPAAAVNRHTHDAAGDLVRVTDPTGSVTEMTYDAAHRRTSIKDRLGNSTGITYHAPTGMPQIVTDPKGNKLTATYVSQTQGSFTFFNVTKIEHADGTSVGYEFDARGNPVTIIDRAGKSWKYTYNAQGLPLTLTSPNAAVSKWTYNANGTTASVTTATGHTTTYERDNLGRVTKVTHPDGSARLFAYDAADKITQQTDENGKSVKFVRNENRQVVSQTDELGAAESVIYNPSLLPMQSTDRLGNKTAFAYNRNNQISKLTDALGNEVEFAYDSLNRMTAIKDAIGTRTAFAYNKEGVPTTLTDARGQVWKKESNTLRQITKTTSPLGVEISQEFDAVGRVTSISNGMGEKSVFEYDRLGQIASVVAPGGLKTTMTRNDLGRIATLTDPAGSLWANQYDESGRTASVRDPLNRTSSLVYDSRGRVAEVKLPDDLGTVSHTYDPVGSLLATRFSDGSELLFTRDDKGRLLESKGLALAYDANGQIIASNGLTIERDSLGRIASVTYAPDKVVRYTYNPRGAVTKITDWLGAETEFSYDLAGAMTAIRRPNAVVTSFSHDEDGRLTTIEEQKGETIGRISMTYDKANRVISEERNIPAIADPGTGVEEFAYAAASQLTSAAYDAAGRVKSDAKRAYSWDISSRLTGFTAGDASVSFNYDARGHVIARSAPSGVTSYVVNYATGQPAIATERLADADRRYYIHLPNGKLLYSIEAASNARRFYHFDARGTTTLLTGDDGAVTDTYEVTPYGETVAHSGSSDNPFTFLGAWGVMQQDQAGLFLMGFRFYDANSARFLSRDRELSPSPRAINPYQYAMANPVNYSDPRGLSAQAAFERLPLFLQVVAGEVLSDITSSERMNNANDFLIELEAFTGESFDGARRLAMQQYQDFLDKQQWEEDRKRKAARQLELANQRAIGVCGLDFACDAGGNRIFGNAPIAPLPPAGLAGLATQPPILFAPNGPSLTGGVDFAKIATLDYRNPASLVGLDGGTLRFLISTGLVGNDGSTFTLKAMLVGLDGGSLVGLDSATIMARLVGNDGASVIARDGAGVVARDGAGVVARDGAGFQK